MIIYMVQLSFAKSAQNICIVWYYCHSMKYFIEHALPCHEHVFVYSRQAGPEGLAWYAPGDLMLKGGESKS